MRAQTEKTTFTCKDDFLLTERTRRWTYSALLYFQFQFVTFSFFCLQIMLFFISLLKLDHCVIIFPFSHSIFQNCFGNISKPAKTSNNLKGFKISKYFDLYLFFANILILIVLTDSTIKTLCYMRSCGVNFENSEIFRFLSEKHPPPSPVGNRVKSAQIYFELS